MVVIWIMKVKFYHQRSGWWSSKVKTLLLLLFGVRCARPGESENTLSVQRPQPHTSNPWKEEEKDKIVGDTKERADHDNREALALLLKPSSPTPSNTGSLRSFQRDTERGTKVLRYWEVLQRGGANECLWETKAPRVTCAGTYGKGNECTAQRMPWVTFNLE